MKDYWPSTGPRAQTALEVVLPVARSFLGIELEKPLITGMYPSFHGRFVQDLMRFAPAGENGVIRIHAEKRISAHLLIAGIAHELGHVAFYQIHRDQYHELTNELPGLIDLEEGVSECVSLAVREVIGEPWWRRRKADYAYAHARIRRAIENGTMLSEIVRDPRKFSRAA